MSVLVISLVYLLNPHVSDHYVTVMACQQKCLQKLATFGMEELPNFVCELFNYLQYAYYKGMWFIEQFNAVA